MFIFPLNLLLPQLISNFLTKNSSRFRTFCNGVVFCCLSIFLSTIFFSPLNELVKSLAATSKMPANFHNVLGLENFEE